MLPPKLSPKVEKKELAVLSARVYRAPTVLPYTYGEVVALMKERNIGRPSTYAKIIDTLIERKYVKETKSKRLLATRRGMAVYYYLAKGYSSFISEAKTRHLERIMDEIESGRRDYQQVLKELYEEVMTIRETET